MPFTYDPMLAVVRAVLDMGAPAGGRSRGMIDRGGSGKSNQIERK